MTESAIDRSTLPCASPTFPAAKALGIHQRDRARWLAARHRGLGGSEVAAILGLHPYKSELEVYADKIGAVPPANENDLPEVALWGQIFEEPILREYGRRSGRVVVPSNELHSRIDRPWHLLTPDGVQVANDVELEGPGTAEVKTTGYGDWQAEGIPAYVQVQVQHGFLVTGASWGTLIWLPFPERRLQWRDLRPHHEFLAFLSERIDAFWTRVVQRREPDADGSESSIRALFHLYPELTDECIELAEAEPIADELEAINAEMTRMEQRKREITARVLQTLGPYKVGLLDDGRYWTSWRVEPRTENCAGCGTVHRNVGGFRAARLMQPRKKPHALARDRRPLIANADPEIVELLEASLRGLK